MRSRLLLSVESLLLVPLDGLEALPEGLVALPEGLVELPEPLEPEPLMPEPELELPGEVLEPLLLELDPLGVEGGVAELPDEDELPELAGRSRPESQAARLRAAAQATAARVKVFIIDLRGGK